MKTKHFSVPVLSGNPSFPWRCPPLSLSLSWCCTTWQICFCGLSGRYRTGGGGLRCGAGVFDPFGSSDHAWRRQQRHHCTLLWRRRDRAGQDLLLALLLEQLFLGVLVSIGLLVSRVPLLGVLGSNAEFFPMQSGIFRSLHWVRRFLSCPTAWRCWCVQRAQ